MSDTAEAAEALHGADDGARFTITIEGPESRYRWSGPAIRVLCMIELISARAKMFSLNGSGDGGRAEA